MTREGTRGEQWARLGPAEGRRGLPSGLNGRDDVCTRGPIRSVQRREFTRRRVFLRMPIPLCALGVPVDVRVPGIGHEKTFTVDVRESYACCWDGGLDLRQPNLQRTNSIATPDLFLPHAGFFIDMTL